MKQDLTEDGYVYSNTGTTYVYSHTDGDWAWCYPTFLVQITDYDQQGYSQEEEVSDHLVRVLKKTLSNEPWVKFIHEETKLAIEKQAEELTYVCGVTAQAKMNLKKVQKELEDLEHSKNDEMEKIIKKYNILGHFKDFIGQDKLYFVSPGWGEYNVPSISLREKCEDLRLKYNSKTGVFEYNSHTYDDVIMGINVFKTRNEAEAKIHVLFSEVKYKSIKSEIEWGLRHDFLNISQEATDAIKCRKEDQKQKELDRVKTAMDQSIRRYEKLQEKYKG